MQAATVTIHELPTTCEEAFSKRRNRTLERIKFFSRKQEEKPTRRQFWYTLTRSAANCEFGELTSVGHVHTEYVMIHAQDVVWNLLTVS